MVLKASGITKEEAVEHPQAVLDALAFHMDGPSKAKGQQMRQPNMPTKEAIAKTVTEVRTHVLAVLPRLAMPCARAAPKNEAVIFLPRRRGVGTCTPSARVVLGDVEGRQAGRQGAPCLHLWQSVLSRVVCCRSFEMGAMIFRALFHSKVCARHPVVASAFRLQSEHFAGKRLGLAASRPSFHRSTLLCIALVRLVVLRYSGTNVLLHFPPHPPPPPPQCSCLLAPFHSIRPGTPSLRRGVVSAGSVAQAMPLKKDDPMQFYTDMRKLGQGASGTVFVGTDVRNGEVR